MDTNDDDIRSWYYSVSGYRIWGGHHRPTPAAHPYAWMSVGLVVGVALVVATYVAMLR